MNPIADYLQRLQTTDAQRHPNTLSSVTEVSACLYRGFLPTSSGLLYTNRKTTRLSVREFIFCNTTAGALTYTLSIVPPATADAADYAIYHQVTLGPHSTDKFNHWLFMMPEEMIYGSASGSGISCRISALEMNPL